MKVRKKMTNIYWLLIVFTLPNIILNCQQHLSNWKFIIMLFKFQTKKLLNCVKFWLSFEITIFRKIIS